MAPFNKVRILYLFLLLTGYLYAQPGTPPAAPAQGSVKGLLLDSETNQPIEFASVAVIKKIDSSIVTGGVSNEKGMFKILQLKNGTYCLKIKFIGYNTYYSADFEISDNSLEKDLGVIKLQSSAKELDEIVVSETQSTFRTSIDKKVYDVSKDIVNQNGSATDVLKNVPAVTVDIDGNISMRGSGNLTVLIDGRPSGLTATNQAQVLEQIPANTIENIELITNPSAKYDPDGMTGIINIVLKKSKKPGINGSASISAGSSQKYDGNYYPKSNGSLNLNLRTSKLNIYTNLGYRYHDGFFNGYTYNTNFLSTNSYHLNQTVHGTRTHKMNNAKAGIDFYMDTQNTLSLSAAINNGSRPSAEYNDYYSLTSSNDVTAYYQRNSTSADYNNNLDLAANYRRTFLKKDRLFTTDVSYSDFRNSNNSNVFKYAAAYPDESQKIASDFKNKVTTLQVDYTEPLNEKTKLEMGYKSIFRNMDNGLIANELQNNEWINDPNRTNNFIYNEGVHALYGTFSSTYKKASYQLGLRAEQALMNSELINTTEKFSRNYFSLYPTLHLSQKLNHGQEVQLSYSRRIDRPSMRDLNPFPEYTDPQNLQRGNPNLNPSYTNSLEFTYLKYFASTTLSATLFYRHSEDMITRIRTLSDPVANIYLLTVTNLNSGQSYGAETMLKNNFYKWWNLTTSFNFFETHLYTKNKPDGANNSGFVWNGRIMSNMTLWKNLQLQLSYFYMAPMPTIQGTMKAMHGGDLGIKKDFWKNKGSIGINLTDVFNSRRFSILGQGDDFSYDLYRKRDSRILTFTLSYRFGKADISNKRKPRNTENNNEQRQEDGF